MCQGWLSRVLRYIGGRRGVRVEMSVEKEDELIDFVDLIESLSESYRTWLAVVSIVCFAFFILLNVFGGVLIWEHFLFFLDIIMTDWIVEKNWLWPMATTQFYCLIYTYWFVFLRSGSLGRPRESARVGLTTVTCDYSYLGQDPADKKKRYRTLAADVFIA